MKYTITIFESPVCIAHKLNLPYGSKCNSLHGHNYSVEVVIETRVLNRHGMVADFTHLKGVVKKYDHTFLGDPKNYPDIQLGKFCLVEPSTAESFAAVLFEDLEAVLKGLNSNAWVVSVSVWETPNNKVTVTGD